MEVENSGQQEVGGYNCSLGSLSFLLLGSTSWLEESSAWCTCQKKTQHMELQELCGVRTGHSPPSAGQRCDKSRCAGPAGTSGYYFLAELTS